VKTNHRGSRLLVGTTYIISTYSTSYAFQRPIQTSILTLLTTGIVLLLSSWLPSQFAALRNRSYSSTSYLDKTKTHASRRRNAVISNQKSRVFSQRKVRAAVIAVVVTLCVRIEILRRVINNSQCSGHNLAVSVDKSRRNTAKADQLISISSPLVPLSTSSGMVRPRSRRYKHKSPLDHGSHDWSRQFSCRRYYLQPC